MQSLLRHSWPITLSFLAFGCGDDATGTGGQGGSPSPSQSSATTGGPATTGNTSTTSATTSSATTASTGGGMSCFGEAYVSEIGPGISCGQLFSSWDWMEGPVSIDYAPPAIELTYGPYLFTGTVGNDGTFSASYVHDESISGDACSPWNVNETLSGTINLGNCTILATYTYTEAPAKTSDFCTQITCPVETAPVGISPQGSPCAGVFSGPQPGVDCLSCMKQSCCDQVAVCGAETTCVDCYLGDDGACTPAATQAANSLAECVATECQAACESPAFPADCEASLPSASGGVCMPPLDSTFLCNLFTNEGCPDGEACSIDPGIGGTSCFPLAPAVVDLCLPCDGDCGAGMICVGTSEPGSARCAAHCCADSDCGPGATCSLGLGLAILGEPIGICQD